MTIKEFFQTAFLIILIFSIFVVMGHFAVSLRKDIDQKIEKDSLLKEKLRLEIQLQKLKLKKSNNQQPTTNIQQPTPTTNVLLHPLR